MLNPHNPIVISLFGSPKCQAVLEIYFRAPQPTVVSPLVPEIRSDSALELGGALADNAAQVLEIVAGSDAKPAHKVLGC